MLHRVPICVWLLALLATVRLTRLLTRDSLLPVAWVRGQVAGRLGTESEWYTLVTCVWCSSFWFGLGTSALAWWATVNVWSAVLPWFVIVASGLGMSLITAIVLTELD